jgi:hypothetical protein
MPIAWFAVALLLMLVGLLGAVLPLLPGLPLILAGVYLYALATGLAAGVGLGHLVIYTLIGGAASRCGRTLQQVCANTGRPRTLPELDRSTRRRGCGAETPVAPLAGAIRLAALGQLLK